MISFTFYSFTQYLLTWEENVSTEPKKNLMNSPTNDPNDITNETKNELTPEQWNDIGKISGIYKIINKVNGKYYVGSSVDIPSRRNQHLRMLDKNRHTNVHLQNAWNKYGKELFHFVVVELLLESELLTREQFYLDECKSNPDSNYNLTYSSTAPMRSPSKMMIERVKSGLKLYWAKPESKRLKSEHAKIYLSSESTRKKMSVSAITAMTSGRRKWLSETTKKQLEFGHPSADTTVYRFKNVDGRTFSGIRSEFIKDFNLPDSNVSKLISGKRNKVCGWTLVY